MANLIQQFRQLLLNKRFFRVAWFAKDLQLTPEPEEALAQLPDDLSAKLIGAVNELPVHPCEQAAVLQAIDDAIAQWKKRPHASPNSIVVLSDPVSSVARVLTSGLHELDANQDQPLPIKLLDWVERPSDVRTIKQQVKENLDLADADAPEQNSSGQAAYSHGSEYSQVPEYDQTLMVVPNLCWCFLRSAEGLDGLDYLQDLLPQNPAQFWILGSGIVGWEYLKSTLQFHAYCGSTVVLPALSGEELQSWLSPIIEQFDIGFPDAALHKRLQNPGSLANIDVAVDKPIETLSGIGQEVSATVQSSVQAIKDELMPEDIDNSESSSEQAYFRRLANISDGVSIVALQLFIKSLRYQADSVNQPSPPNERSATTAKDCLSSGSSEPGATASVPDDRHRLTVTTPKLPSLPDLSQSDLYLLYSLLLHSDLTVRALARSLGDSIHIVNNQVQILRNAGVIEQQGQVIKTNPVYYPQLRRELARNNFMIEVP
ncbi:MAG: hypothetical protein WBG38_07280 [Nodosilinea sp.]